MPVDRFLDTNVLVYAFDANSPRKQSTARELIAEENWACSWQVIQEFANVALHKFEVPMQPSDLSDYVDLVLWPKCAVLPSYEIFESALGFHRSYGYRLYDGLIISSALACGASELISEDLQHGQHFGTLLVRNPFL